MSDYAGQDHIVLKVQDGTPPAHADLCRSCAHSHIMRGTNNQVHVRCEYMGKPVTFEVAECNHYQDRSKPTLYAMEEIAWRIVSSKGSGTVGFVDAQTFRRRQAEEGKPARVPGF